jgi:3-phosphoshikimate 1-carboxyvinyltransferase
VALAQKGIGAQITGLHTLNKKESMRLNILKEALSHFIEVDRGVSDDVISWSGQVPCFPTELRLSTAGDHRLAMAFCTLAGNVKLFLDDVECVQKSFPHFWREMEKLGYQLRSE